MRVLHAIGSADPAGGGPIEGVRQLTTVLAAAGHHIELVTADAPGTAAPDFPVPVHELGPARLKYGYLGATASWLERNLCRFDVVVVNGIWQYHGFAAHRVARAQGVPYVVFTHGMLDPYFKRQYPLKHVKKWLYWPWGEYRILRDAAAVIFTCEEERRLARQSFWLYTVNEQVVSYGTAGPRIGAEDSDQFYAAFPECRGKRLVLFLSRIHPKKGCDLAIEAFAAEMGSHPEWRLVMAGPDQVGWQRQLQARAMALGIADRITWTGMLQGARKAGALATAEVFLLPSHQENFGIVVAEALAAGLPPLISKEVNIWREVVEDGAGLAAEDNLEGTRALLRQWLVLRVDERERMRRLAATTFEERFEIHQAARSFMQLLERVVLPGARNQLEHSVIVG